MGLAADRVKEKHIIIPEEWEVVEHKEVDNKLSVEYKIYNWKDREFFPFAYWLDKGEINAETMEYTSGMIAIREIFIAKKEESVIVKPIKRMDKSSFLKIIKNYG